MSETIQIFGEQFENVNGIKAYKPNGDVVIFHSSGVNLKTLTIVNNTTSNILFYNCIVDGYWNEMMVRSGETAAIQYVTPTAEVGEYPIDYTIAIEEVPRNVTVDTPTGVEYVTDFPPAGLYISNAAADGATVTFTSGAM